MINAFNVDPLYLKHELEGQMPDYRVSYKVYMLLSVVCNKNQVDIVPHNYVINYTRV